MIIFLKCHTKNATTYKFFCNGGIVIQYEVNDKVLRTLPMMWRAQETAIRASKDLEAMPLEELVGVFIIHEQVY